MISKVSTTYVPRLVKVFQCPTCPWFRCLSEDRAMREKLYKHPVYGTVTGEQMAVLDIERHKCYTHRIRLHRLGKPMDPDEQFADVVDLEKELGLA
jgi:hypothetical protein